MTSMSNHIPRPGDAKRPVNAIGADRKNVDPGGPKPVAATEGYADEKCICRGCQGEFVFTAEQKHRLYVDYRAHTATRRVLCGGCKNDLAMITKELAAFDEKLVNAKDRTDDIGVATWSKMIALLRRKFKYTQKIDKSKLAQYKKLQKNATAR